MRISRTRLALALALLAAAPASAAEHMGPLPRGAISHSVAGPSDEIILYLAFDPAPLVARLPRGVRFRTLAEKAADFPGLARYIEAHPERRLWAWSYFEIIGIKAARYDRVRARFDGGRGGMAVWYPDLVRTDITDRRPIGDQDFAIGSWVSDPHLAAYMRSRGFPATDAHVRFERVSGRVSATMRAAGIKIEGGCRLEGEPFIPRWARDALNYETMWTPAGEGDTFEVVSWAGHRSLKCVEPRWRVSGDHPFARAFNDPALGDPHVLPAEFAYGYFVKSGLYRRPAAARAPRHH